MSSVSCCRVSIGILLACVTALALACGGGRSLDVSLVTPGDSDPFADLVQIEVRFTGADIERITTSVDAAALQLSLPEVPLGPDRQIELLGLDGAGRVLSRGRSRVFELTEDTPQQLVIFFARVDVFSPLRSALSTPRYDHTATLLDDGRLLIAGGRNGDTVLQSIELLDPEQMEFVQSAVSLRQGRSRHRAVTVEGLVVVVGGERNGQFVNRTEIHALVDGTVRELLMKGRVGHTLTVLPDRNVLIVGGERVEDEEDEEEDEEETEITPTSLVELLDPRAGTVVQSSPLSPGRSQHVATGLADGRVLVAGGERRAERRTNVLADAAIYDPASGQWGRVASLPTAVTRATATLLGDGAVLVVGGETSAGVLSQKAYLYDVTRDVWSEVGPARGRVEHAATPLDNGALTAGGDDTADRFSDGLLRDAGRLAGPRRRFTLSTLLDGTAIAVGGLRSQESLGDAETFRP